MMHSWLFWPRFNIPELSSMKRKKGARSPPSASKFLWLQAMNRGSTAAPLLSHQYFESLNSELQQFYLTHRDVEKLEIEFADKFQRLATEADKSNSLGG
jgi:hypothetical protein